jgi:hypothetical protein
MSNLNIETRIIVDAAIFFGGFLWSYLFVRQFLYNLLVAYPVIRKMNALQEDLIAPGAKTYTNVSCVISGLLSLAILFPIVYFCSLEVILCFCGGAVLAILLFLLRMKPSNKSMFDLFVSAYYRFVPDDELRTILYKKEYKKVKSRLKSMGISGDFIPEFKA